ncbi:MAG: FtsX-like permease family protein, partial [Candidatus Saccharimonadales bacterium]
PMVLPYDTVEQLLNLKKLPDAASVSDKLHRLESVRDQAATLTVPLCYRNSDSSLTVQQTIQQQTYIKTQKGSKDYIEPSIIYNLPSNTSCANPTIASDTRTASEKGLDAKQKGFDEKFGHVNNPISKIITVKVVGISPASATTTSGQPEVTPNSSLDDVVNNLLQTSGIGQAIPQTLYEQLPKDKRFDDIVTYEPIYIFGPENNNIFYVEFANSTDAQRFIREQGCTTQYDNTCQPADHPYHLSLAFSNGAAIDDIQTKAGEWFNYALIGIVTLAAIIMWIAVGRTMADSRRETAIFRAIGFKRGDIASTYILYTAMLSTLIAVFAVGIGTLGAYIVDRLYAPDLTVQAQYGFGALDLTKQVSLIGIDYRQLGLVLIACLATGLLSVIIPLLRNVRRNPIRDMRDE